LNTLSPESESPSVFAAFARSIDELVAESADQEDLRTLCLVLDNVLTTTAGLMPVPARQRTLDTKRKADVAMDRLRRRS
jgi:hypothetical protein